MNIQSAVGALGLPSWLKSQCLKRQATEGFTLIEGLVVMGMVGILASIAVPGWLQFSTRQKLNAAQDEAYQVFRTAQDTAIQRHDKWQASFRQVGKFAQWSVHPIDALPTEAVWQGFGVAIQIDADETTLANKNGIYRVQFTHKGNVNGRLGRLTFSTPNGGPTKRCVFISTLLGAMRRGENQPKPDRTGRSCY